MEQTQDLTKIKNIVKKRKWWLILPFFLVVLVVAVVALILPNIYESTATILIQDPQIPSDMVPSTVTSFADQRIQSITQEVTSRAKILDLVQKYDLLPGKREKLTAEDLVERIKARIKVEPIDAEIKREKDRPILMTIAFSLSYEDESPGKAQAVTNEIASYFMEKNLAAREKHARGTTRFMEEQLNHAKQKIDSLQTSLADYRTKHLEQLPEFTTLNMQKLEKLNSDISNLNMQIRSLEEQRATITSRLATLDPYSGASERVMSPEERLQQAQLERAALVARYSDKHPMVKAKDQEISELSISVSDPLGVDRARDRLRELELKLADLKARYTDKHPEVQRTLLEIESAKKELKTLRTDASTGRSSEAGRATNPAYVALKSDLEKMEVSILSMKTEKERTEQQIDEVYRKLHAMPDVAKEYNELTTDYENARLHYSELNQKLLAARISQGMEEEQLGENFRIVEPAFLPEKPAKPNRLAIMLIGVVLGIGCAVGLASLREFTDNSIRDVKTLEDLSGMPVFSLIPRIVTREDRIRARKKRVAWATGTVSVIVLAVVVFHFYVMDLYIFYAKLMRLVQRKFPV